MDNGSSYDRKTKGWFLWGTVLTWALSIPFILGIFHSFREVSEQKATGLGAIAGGLAEGFVTFGLILAFLVPVVAIVLLIRSFSSGHWMLYFRFFTSFGMCLWFWQACPRGFSSPIQSMQGPELRS